MPEAMHITVHRCRVRTACHQCRAHILPDDIIVRIGGSQNKYHLGCAFLHVGRVHNAAAEALHHLRKLEALTNIPLQQHTEDR